MAHPRSEQTGMNAATILVVDDDPATLLLCRKKLSAEGYAVLQAAGSSEALQLFAKHDGTIHLVLTDIILPPPGFQLSVENNPFPRVNGVELVDRLLASGKELRVMLMSTSSEQELLYRGLIRNNWLFLRKPINAETLHAMVRQVLNGPPSVFDTGKSTVSTKSDVEWFG
ncbi:MAG: response regulator [Nitrospiraceae bacterium]